MKRLYCLHTSGDAAQIEPRGRGSTKRMNATPFPSIPWPDIAHQTAIPTSFTTSSVPFAVAAMAAKLSVS
jgi:hypothetical protein